MFLLLLSSVAAKYREKYLKGLENPSRKYPAPARNPRECTGFAFYMRLEWDNPESLNVCLFLFTKPLQKKKKKSSVRSGACFGQVLSENT